MKLVSLNIWGGKVFEPLVEFIRKQSEDTDIFCFQEIFSTEDNIQTLASGARADMFQEIAKALSGFSGMHFPAVGSYDYDKEKIEADVSAGHAIFIKKPFEALASGSFYTHNDFSVPRMSGFVSYVRLEQADIVNVHGIWTGGGKDDNEARIEQAGKIRDFLGTLSGRKVVCGDFNLNPDTESLKAIGKDLRNLISEYGVKTTRSGLYPRKNIMPFADYTFVSPEIEIKGFQVPEIAVSDHLPMILEFV